MWLLGLLFSAILIFYCLFSKGGLFHGDTEDQIIASIFIIQFFWWMSLAKVPENIRIHLHRISTVLNLKFWFSYYPLKLFFILALYIIINYYWRKRKNEIAIQEVIKWRETHQKIDNNK
jgi:TRAP-type C4-dicarboxylate transport system permease small subunit